MKQLFRIEACSHPSWCVAMEEEMNALELNHTWDLVSLPLRKKEVSCKWVLDVKMNLSIFVSRLKVWLFAKVYAQTTYSVDYSETLSSR